MIAATIVTHSIRLQTFSNHFLHTGSLLLTMRVAAAAANDDDDDDDEKG